MHSVDRLPILDEANMLTREVWNKLPHSNNELDIKKQFRGLLSAHIDTFEFDENQSEEEQLTRYWAFLVRAGNEFSVSSEDIRTIRSYVNYEIDHIDARMPDNNEDKVYFLYGLINVVLINGLPASSDLNIPELEANICEHFAKILGFNNEAVNKMVMARIDLEDELLK